MDDFIVDPESGIIVRASNSPIKLLVKKVKLLETRLSQLEEEMAIIKKLIGEKDELC